MEQTSQYTGMNNTIKEKLRAELGELDRELVQVDGSMLKPSQCYRLGVDPPHVLFNTNCPDDLKKRIQAILIKYMPNAEGSAS